MQSHYYYGKIHSSPIHHLTVIFQLSKNNRECATSSEDGTCIMWDLATYKRSQMVMANTLFQVQQFYLLQAG
jgi:hypothetical protein